MKEVGQLTIENVLGAGVHLTKIDLAIRAELTLRLTSGNTNIDCPVATVKNALKMIAIGEKLPPELRIAIKNYI